MPPVSKDSPAAESGGRRRKQVAEFGALVSRLRREAGFPSARDFFNSSGARPFFRCTYAQYANVEGGRSAPTPALLERIAIALRLAVDEDKLRELIESYLRLLLGSEELLGMVRLALDNTRSNPSSTPLRQAIRRNIDAQRVRVSEEAADAMYKSPAHYWVSTIYCSDPGVWDADRLAKALGLPRPAVASAIADFERLGLIVRAPEGGGWRCASGGRMFIMPHKGLHTEYGEHGAARHEMTTRQLEQMTRRSGAIDMRQVYFLRASAKALRQYYPYLAQTVYGADIYYTPRREPDTAMFAVEVCVRKLLPL